MASVVADGERGARRSGRGLAFLVGAIAVLFVVVVVILVVTWATMSGPDHVDPRTFALGDISEGAAAVLVENVPVFLVREGDEVWAIAPITPHLEQPIWWCAAAGQFYDPMHGSIFDMDGVKLGGPARHGLDRYPVTIDDGIVTVDVDRQIPGQPLHTRSVRPMPATSGFFCGDPTAPPQAPPR